MREAREFAQRVLLPGAPEAHRRESAVTKLFVAEAV